jgi:hypothetical protein
VPVLGYTWFPLFTMIDWRYRFGKRPVDHFLLDLGVFTLARNGAPGRWETTPLVAAFRALTADPSASVGPLARAAQTPG